MSRSYNRGGQKVVKTSKGGVFHKYGTDREDYKEWGWNHRTRKEDKFERTNEIEEISYLEQMDDYKNWLSDHLTKKGYRTQLTKTRDTDIRLQMLYSTYRD